MYANPKEKHECIIKSHFLTPQTTLFSVSCICGYKLLDTDNGVTAIFSDQTEAYEKWLFYHYIDVCDVKVHMT